MPRNGSGTMTVSNTFVAGNTITASGHNTNNTDIASEISNSLALDGQSVMTGQLKAANGSAAAPSVTFGSDLDTGFYRKGANVIGAAVGGTEVGTITATGFSGLGAVPVGAVMDWPGQTAPTGWIFGYGQAVSRTTYAALFAEYGTTYGAGDGSTTFNVFDGRGRVVIGKDDMGGTAANRITSAGCGIDGTTLGATGGLQTLQAHTHGLTAASAASSGAHTHTGTTGTESASHSHSVSGTTSDQSNGHTHTAYQAATAVSVTGPGTVYYLGTGSPTTISSDSTGHTHTFSVTSGGNSVTHTHSFTTASDGAHTHTLSGNTDSTGTGSSHGSVQPSIVLNKIIFTGVA